MSNIEDAMLNNFFEYVNALPEGSEISYSVVDEQMCWNEMDSEDQTERARLNELRNQTKARINSMAKRGVDTIESEFSPFQLVIRVQGASWMKVADYSYVKGVFSKGTKRVSSAITNICNRSMWANKSLTMTPEQRTAVAIKVEDLQFREKQLREELKYITDRIQSMSDSVKQEVMFS